MDARSPIMRRTCGNVDSHDGSNRALPGRPRSGKGLYSVEPYRMCYYRTSVDVRPFQSTFHNSQHPFIKAILTVLLDMKK